MSLPSMGDLSRACDRAERIIEEAKNLGIGIVTLSDPGFPARLSVILTPLFIKGDSTCLNADSVAVIGTRLPTEFGRKTAEHFGVTLGKPGFHCQSRGYFQ